MAMCMKLIDQESVPIDGSASNHNYLVNYPPDMGKVNRVTQHAIGCERTGKIIRRNSSGKLAMSSGERENEGNCRRGGITGEMYWDTYGGNLDINMHSLFLLCFRQMEGVEAAATNIIILLEAAAGGGVMWHRCMHPVSNSLGFV